MGGCTDSSCSQTPVNTASPRAPQTQCCILPLTTISAWPLRCHSCLACLARAWQEPLTRLLRAPPAPTTRTHLCYRRSKILERRPLRKTAQDTVRSEWDLVAKIRLCPSFGFDVFHMRCNHRPMAEGRKPTGQAPADAHSHKKANSKTSVFVNCDVVANPQLRPRAATSLCVVFL